MANQSNGHSVDPTVQGILMNRLMWNDPIATHQLDVLVNSTLMSRQALIQRGGEDDPRRNINEECGYPDTITPQQYRDLYDREPIASRVVQVLPMECWQVTPAIYEDEDVDTITPFEQAWHDLGKALRGHSWFQDEEGSPVYEHLMRMDILSGIGSFGVMLLGIDDNKELHEPIDGFTDSPTVMGAMQALYGTDAQHGAVSLSPAPEKPKLPNTVNARPMPSSQEEEDVEDPRRPMQQVPPDEEEVPEDMPEEGMEEEDPNQQGMMLEDEEGQDAEELAESGEYEDEADEFGDIPVETEHQLLFLRCFDETLVQVVQYESDPTNPRFGHPVMYNITLNDPKFLHGGSGLSMNVAKVHWSRVLHVADNLGSSEVFGVPRMQPVYNRLLDIRKLHSGSAEMYWKGAFPGFNLATHPQLGGDVSFDSDDIKDQMEKYMNGLQRYTAFVGASMNSLAPQVVDPASQIQVQLEAVCVRLAVPMRVFMGSERGELASSQDSGTWNDRLKQRMNSYLTPRLLVPFIDRLIQIGVLPEPTGYSVTWPDLSAASDLEKAQKANMLSTSLSTYVQGGVESVMTWTDYLVKIMGFDEEEAKQIDSNARTQGDKNLLTMDPAMDEAMQEAQMEQMTNPELVPDNIQTGDQHHYEAGSQDKAAELEHERIISGQENGPPQEGGGLPPNGGPPGQPGNPVPPKPGKPGMKKGRK